MVYHWIRQALQKKHQNRNKYITFCLGFFLSFSIDLVHSLSGVIKQRNCCCYMSLFVLSLSFSCFERLDLFNFHKFQFIDHFSKIYYNCPRTFIALCHEIQQSNRIKQIKYQMARENTIIYIYHWTCYICVACTHCTDSTISHNLHDIDYV